jgi:hypothetical protein
LFFLLPHQSAYCRVQRIVSISPPTKETRCESDTFHNPDVCIFAAAAAAATTTTAAAATATATAARYSIVIPYFFITTATAVTKVLVANTIMVTFVENLRKKGGGKEMR